jgi:hypothetical protein
MIKKIKTIFVVMALCILTTQIPFLPSANAKESAADTNQVLVFLSDVVGLDLKAYEINLASCHVNNYSDVSIIGYIGYTETTGKYTLSYYDYVNFDNSLLHCSFKFANNTLVSATLYADQGELIFSKQPPANLAVAAETFLTRYSEFSKDSNINTLKTLLSNVDVSKNSTNTVGNIKQDISVTSYATSINWKSIYNGVEYPGMGIAFQDGIFHNFGDDRCIYTIANTSVNISKDQAISLAISKAETFSYKYNDKVISNFSIVKDQILAELRTSSRYTVNELYPYWEVMLPLDELYPGQVSVIRVDIWANDGEIMSCQTLSYGGPAPSNNISTSNNPENSASTNSTPTQIASGTQQIPIPIIALIVTAILIPTLITIAVFAKKKNK